MYFPTCQQLILPTIYLYGDYTMDLVKHTYVHPNKKCSETVYKRPNDEIIINEDKLMLLGFKDSIAVVSPKPTSMEHCKVSSIEMDPKTGDKFIVVNGMRLKMIGKKMLLKKGALLSTLKKSKIIAASSVNEPNGKAVNSQKVFSNAVYRLSNAISDKERCNVDVKCNESDRENSKSRVVVKLQSEGDNNEAENKKMQALDLTKTSRSDKCVQVEIGKSYAEIGIQVDEGSSLMTSEEELDLLGEGGSQLFADILSDINFPNWNYNLSKDEQAVKFFTDLKAAMQPNDKGNMPIHIAVITNNLPMVKKRWYILKALDQSIDLPNSNGFTSLQLSIMNYASEIIVDFLLENKARLDVYDSDGNNVIHLAIEYQREDILTNLLSFVGENVNILNEFNHGGITPLMMSVIRGLHKCAAILLANGAEVNVRDQISGRTALFHAAENQDIEMVQLLLKYKADTKIKNFFGTSPHDAMYEVEDMPDDIKLLILRRGHKKRQYDEHTPQMNLRQQKQQKKERSSPNKPQIKTYSRFKTKAEQTIMSKEMIV